MICILTVGSLLAGCGAQKEQTIKNSSEGASVEEAGAGSSETNETAQNKAATPKYLKLCLPYLMLTTIKQRQLSSFLK